LQAITHFLVGIIIQSLFINFSPPYNIFLIIVIAFFSHFLIDCIAKITYHLKDPQPHDKFWVLYHIIIFTASAIVLVYFWKPFWWGMGVAVLIDIYDWIIIRGIRKLKKNPLWLQGYEMHPLIDKFREKFFAWLPDWNEKRYAVVPEAILILALLVIMYLI
jgi:hypothetical protein